jgi:glycosyltransferase involved in cell wall biosynthesis
VTHLRVGVICDYAEESWFSMDLVGEMLCAELDARHCAALRVTRIRPAFVRRFSHPGWGGRGMRVRFNADRALNRFFDYPRELRRLRGDFDVFHVVDHSYAHLALELDGSRTIVACHDLDAFRCLLPGQNRRSVPLRMMARRSLAGMRSAARVCCSTNVARTALAASGLVQADRIVLLPYGVHPAFSPRPNRAADDEIARLLGPADPDSIELLHVGSTIARKRIDVLLRIMAATRASFPKLRLIKAGGTLTAEQARLASELGVRDSIEALPFLEAAVLAALYRRAAMVLITSESEGFGLPIIEAMACGTPVISSDIPELREAGGAAASYCPMGDVPAWRSALCAMLNERAANSAAWAERCAEAISQASRFSWAAYADACALLYRELANRK